MAIAGLHNVPVIESSILRESQSSSSGHTGNQGGISTRASSIRQMWLELEDECVVNHGRGRGPRGRLSCRERESRGGLDDSSESENDGSVINPDDHQSMTSEQSQDLGLIERERVRRIFQEWKNNGGAPQVSNVSHRNRGSRAQWLGETERERVRVVREWIQMTSQSREHQVSEVGSQIDQVRNGHVLEPDEARTKVIRRPIRRLCGRQALLDLLAKKEQERRQELQGLQMSQPVSRFAHRNRIQSLLRIRCFQNMRSFELKSPRSTERELGLLRQRQTVSGLREGFLSRLDNNVQVHTCDFSGRSSENNALSFRDNLIQVNVANENVDVAYGQINLVNEVLTGPQVQNEPTHEIGAPEQNESSKELDDGSYNGIVSERDSDVGPLTSFDQLRECPSDLSINSQHEALLEIASDDENRSVITTSEPPIGFNQLRECPSDLSINSQHEALLEIASDDENRSVITTSEPPIGFADEIYMAVHSQEILRSGNELYNDLEETHEMSHQFDRHSENININNQLDDEVQLSEDVNGQISRIQVEDWPEQVTTMFNESTWEVNDQSNPWEHDDQVEIDRPHRPLDGEEFSDAASESEVGEQNDGQDYWNGNGSLETPRDWLGMHSSSGVTSGRLNTYYFSDDDNVYQMELRELLNRRRVSSLLHSDFRESLDQLVQTYVERQTHMPDDWESHEMPQLPFTAQNQNHIGTEHGEDLGHEGIHVEQSQQTLHRPPPLPQDHWGHDANWSRRESWQRPGTEWEIINDLRINMARLQQRLNNMQRMLEACMDMQLELQRSVRQEVSAALNRTIASEHPDNILPKDNFHWDCVKKGICCICLNTNIDCLLYRCGHMCTCIKCADQLLQDNGKCPMCQAPVIETVRAYFVQ